MLQNLIAVNDALGLGYDIHYWRTADGSEVDFVLYGKRGLHAIEVKRGRRLASADAAGLRAFMRDYPVARPLLVYGGDRRVNVGNIEARPVQEFLSQLPDLLGS